jgi:tetratricopeptide (TPR) repeat protein
MASDKASSGMSESEGETEEIRRLMAKAHLLANERRLDEALALMDRATDLRLGPLEDRLTAWQLKHFILYGMGRYADAISVAENVIALDPGGTMGYMQLSAALSMLGRHSEALAITERSVELEPWNSLAWKRKGDALYRARRYGEALQAQTRAVTLDPDNTTAYIDLARTLEALRRYKEAIDTSRDILSIMCETENTPAGAAKSHNEQARALAVQARSLQALKRWPEALDVSEEALTLSPDRADMWSLRYQILYRLKRYDEALPAAQRVVELRPRSQIEWRKLLALLVKLRRFDEALNTAQRALEFMPDDAKLLSQRVMIVALLCTQGELSNALPLRPNVDLNDPKTWKVAAEELGFLGEFEEALRVCNEGLRRFPTKVDLYSSKMFILTRLGRYRETLATLREAMRTGKPNPVFGHEFGGPKSKPTSESQ